METVTLRPTQAGSIVRDPKTRQPLPAIGKAVEFSTYWRRRLRDGSVEIVRAELQTDQQKPRAKSAAKEA